MYNTDVSKFKCGRYTGMCWVHKNPETKDPKAKIEIKKNYIVVINGHQNAFMMRSNINNKGKILCQVGSLCVSNKTLALR